jgi:type I restriction enzyme S subunit
MIEGRYKVYPEYKDSGVEWLGNIPKDWNTSCLRWYISIASGEGLSNNDFEILPDEKYLFRVIGGNGTLGYTPYLNTTGKAFAIGRVGALCGNIHFVNKKCWITDNALKISTWRKFQDGYLFFLLTTARLNEYASKTAQPLITGQQVKALQIVLPSKDEQQHIAAFLDYETAKIDTLIEKQQQLTKLLKEKRQAVISHAVTKGLNPDAPMKDSGVEWVGNIPDKWHVKPLFSVASTESVKNYDGSETNVLSLSYGNIVRRDVDDNFGLLPESFNTYQLVRPGDLILRLTDLQNRCS